MSEWLIDTLAIVVILPVLGVLLWERVRHHDAWRSMVTPLASIIGSGFLVVGPILAGVAGHWAVPAMIGLCALAWLFGSAVRFNIAHAEPLHENEERKALRRLDRIAEVCLAMAYFISVAYYLNLLGAFVLKGIGIVNPLWARWLTTAIIGGLGVLGWLRGFKGIEKAEIYAVTFKLAVIAGVIVALGAVAVSEFGHLSMPEADSSNSLWHDIRVLLGSVILVQGFETARFLGRHYEAAQRVRSMRWAQLLALVIYVAFVALLLPHVSTEHTGMAKETQVIDIVQNVAWLLGPALVLAAVASQLSAAIADMGGAGGLLDAMFERVSTRMAYAGITAAAIAMTWVTDIFGIIALASRAFAVYYGLQCLLAAILAEGRPLRRAYYLVGMLLALVVVVFGLAAE